MREWSLFSGSSDRRDHGCVWAEHGGGWRWNPSPVLSPRVRLPGHPEKVLWSIPHQMLGEPSRCPTCNCPQARGRGCQSLSADRQRRPYVWVCPWVWVQQRELAASGSRASWALTPEMALRHSRCPPRMVPSPCCWSKSVGSVHQDPGLLSPPHYPGMPHGDPSTESPVRTSSWT